MKQTLLLIATILLLGIQSFTQNVGINNDGSDPDPSAALDVKASDKGVLIPRVDFNNLPISPATGLLVYVTANGPDGNNAFYYYDGSQWQKLSGAAGLENFTESNYTYDTKTGVKFLATNAATDVDFVISPKGDGAILAQQPDGTTVGGNNRGYYAIDFQSVRSDATQVASGTGAIILGGGENTSSGYGSVVLGGVMNIASGDASAALGYISSATGHFSFAAGYSSDATSNNSIAIGKDAAASNEYAVAIGSTPTASGYASLAMGDWTIASGRISTAMGNRTTAPSGYETVFGRYNTDYTPSSTTDWIATDRLFVVGNGATDVAKSNALTILKNANTTIGGSLTLNGNGTNTSITFPTTRGTNGQVLTSDGSGNTSWATPYSGLTNFTESNYTYDSKTGVKFLATNTTADVDFVISPKGNGALLAHQPDGTTAGGNNRGYRAVDLQMIRGNSTQVASGSHSTIVGGSQNTASGSISTAMGYKTLASGDYSTAMGNQTSASGEASTAMGFNTTSSGYYSTAIGLQSTASGFASSTIGYQSIASGQYAIAIGRSSDATADHSIAIGKDAAASNEYAVAIGNNPIASGYASLAMGDYTTASGRISTAMGNRTTAPSGYETVFGRYNSDYTPSSTTEWIATDRLFVVGNGATDVAKSNALTILKNANTTIGGSLTLNGNGTNTSITLPTTRGTNGQVLQTDGGGNTSWSSFTGSQWTTSGSNIYYNSGNVGIGTITPNSKLTFDNSHDSGFDEWSDYKILLYTDATPQQSYGIGIKANTLAFNTDHDYDFDQDGSTVMTIQEGKVGIGTASPLALFDLGNSISNRKIILYSFADNDHQFTGLGLNVDALRFQLATTSGNFKFYGATSSTASTELFRIQGNGQIIIPALSTAGVLLNSNTGLVSSSVGTSGQVLTTNGSGGITWTTPSSGTVSSVSGTAPISVATGTTTPVISIAAATTLAAGSMSAADKTKLNAISGTNTGDQTITLTGDVTGSGMESFAATISSASVTNSKLANMASNTMKVNNTAASASPSDLSITANTFPARSSTGNIAAKPVTDFALTILDDANAAAVRTTIGAGTGNGTVTTVTGTAPINVATGATTPVISIAAATTSAAGSMSAADKTKLDGLVGSQWTTSGSNIYYNTGNVGIGTATANAQLQLGNTTANRKIILWQNTNDDHQFYGLGVNSNVFRLQIPNTSANFKFYGATSSSASTELFRIQGDGQIMIPALTTAGVLLNTSTGMITSSIGTNGQVLTTSSGGNLTWTTPNSGTVSAISTINGITGGPITTSGSIGLTGQALALHDLGTIGFITRTGSGTVATRAIKSGTGITVANGDGVVGDPTIALDTYSIGDFAQGGIVFWVDETGHHGLVCAKQDQSDDAKWWAGTYTNTMARGDGPFSGEMNTAIIIANQSYGNGTNYAARICNELKITEGGKTYGDWYLPSIEEAFLMYQNRTIINVTATANGGSNFANWMYWTSTENSNSTAWLQGFLTTSTQDAHDKQYGFNVRAIRAF